MELKSHKAGEKGTQQSDDVPVYVIVHGCILSARLYRRSPDQCKRDREGERERG